MVFKSSNQQSLLSKIATNNGHGENSPYFDGWKAYDSNPFHPIDNPHGVIQMGLAENQVFKRGEMQIEFFVFCWRHEFIFINYFLSMFQGTTNLQLIFLLIVASPMYSLHLMWLKSGSWTTQTPPFARPQE